MLIWVDSVKRQNLSLLLGQLTIIFFKDKKKNSFMQTGYGMKVNTDRWKKNVKKI